jgi:hypothetical protein
MSENVHSLSPAKRLRAPRSEAPSSRWRRGRYTLEIRQHMAWQWQALVIALAWPSGLALSAAILMAAGVPGKELFQEFVVATLFDAQSLQGRAVPGRADDHGRPGGRHRLPRALLEPGARRPDGLGRDRRDGHLDVRGRPAECCACR